jgi:hypothetical protein
VDRRGNAIFDMLLYRPLGLPELKLVAKAGWRAWPLRLPHQPTFYPVLTFHYAQALAREWNTKDDASGFVGFVSRFKVADRFVARYPVKRVGGRSDEELWVPASELAALNDHIRGFIEIVDAFPGPKFGGALDASSRLPADVPPPLASKAPLRFGCPCCRSLTLNTRGKFERCAVCGWADDGQDDRDAELVHGGPNGSLSLSEARRNYAEFRACEQPAQGSVRPPAPDEI